MDSLLMFIVSQFAVSFCYQNQWSCERKIGLENCWEASNSVWDAFGGVPINIAMDGIHHVYPFLEKDPPKKNRPSDVQQSIHPKRGWL